MVSLQTERNIPITILDSKSRSGERSHIPSLDDTSNTEIEDLTTKLEEGDETAESKNTLKNEEIGQNTLDLREKMSISNEEEKNVADENDNCKSSQRHKFLFGEEKTKFESSPPPRSFTPREQSCAKEDDEFPEAISAPTLVNNINEKSKEKVRTSVGPGQDAVVRFVPILLPDGRVMQRDPDDVMEIRTEFTNYCHQEYNDSRTPSPLGEKTKVESKEKVIPIILHNGDKFMPTFTSLDDVEPPNWSAFSKNNRNDKINSDAREKIVPIRLEEQIGKREESFSFRKVSGQSSSSLSSPASSSSSLEDAAIGINKSREKLSKSQEKRVQHSVRFVDEEENAGESLKKRSASLDEKRSARRLTTSHSTESPKKSNLRGRHRHRSGSGGDTKNALGGEKKCQEKTLREIDRDINKIWRELQELDAFPSSNKAIVSAAAAARPPISGGLTGRASPSRGCSTFQHVTPSATNASVTPVKIRTFTTPLPSSVQCSVATESSSPKAGSTSRAESSPVKIDRDTTTSSSPMLRDRVAYNPRKILEPTKPGSITPVFITTTTTTTSSIPTKPYVPSRTITNTAFNTAGGGKPSTVLRQHEKKIAEPIEQLGEKEKLEDANMSGESVQYNNAKNETREPSPLPSYPTNSTDQNQYKCERGTSGNNFDAAADKACQTEESLTKKSKHNCTLQ